MKYIAKTVFEDNSRTVNNTQDNTISNIALPTTTSMIAPSITTNLTTTTPSSTAPLINDSLPNPATTPSNSTPSTSVVVEVNNHNNNNSGISYIPYAMMGSINKLAKWVYNHDYTKSAIQILGANRCEYLVKRKFIYNIPAAVVCLNAYIALQTFTHEEEIQKLNNQINRLNHQMKSLQNKCNQ